MLCVCVCFGPKRVWENKEEQSKSTTKPQHSVKGQGRIQVEAHSSIRVCLDLLI